MIVYLDPARQTIQLYSDKGLETFEFDEVDDMAKQIGRQSVLYVYKAIETNGPEIVQTVNAMIRASGAASSGDPLDELDSQTYYLQSLSKGVLHIQDINVTFDGPGDCKLVDEEMAALIQESMVLRQMIKKKMIRLVDYAEMQKSARKQKRTKEKFQKLRQSTKDAELDSIIIKSDKRGSAEMIAAGMFGGDDDIVKTTDITDSIMNDPTDSMTPEQLDEAIRLGKLAP